MQTSMNQFLKPEILSSQNKWFCPSCNLLSESTRETCIINSAPILIIQLCRFSNQGGQLVKKENFFSSTQSESNKDLIVPITKGWVPNLPLLAMGSVYMHQGSTIQFVESWISFLDSLFFSLVDCLGGWNQ